ncbi:hypothetical protein SASPL_134696 [Salvia splendens]|uniref:Uncharacterized protein n=1 Tax=Salvia splendens TaxID=180675 RepID=A0A8X8WY80_SALSN|nr:hypothetical protein SASPL_134696 [Salvia splendens]
MMFQFLINLQDFPSKVEEIILVLGRECITLHLLLFLTCWLVDSTSSLKSAVCPELLPRGANVSVGVIIDESTRIGKEQKIAMKMAAKDLGHCLNLVLHIKDLHGNLALAASAGYKDDNIQSVFGISDFRY